MIRFACPMCKTVLEATEQQSGVKLACLKCGQRLQVPSPPKNKTVLGDLLTDNPVSRPTGTGRTTSAASTQVGDQPSARTPDRNSVRWYYLKNGQKQGPVTFVELQQLASSQAFGANELVCAEGMGQWLPANKIKGLIPESGKGINRSLHLATAPLRNCWQRIRKLSPRTQLLIAAGISFLLVGTVLLVNAMLPNRITNDEDERQTVARANADKNESEDRKGDKITQEERDRIEKALEARLKREIEAAEAKAKEGIDKLKLESKAAEEKLELERAIAERLKQEIKLAEARIAEEKASAEKLRQENLRIAEMLKQRAKEQPVQGNDDKPSTKQEESKIALSTKAAWNQIGLINVEMKVLDPKAPINYWKQSVLWFGRIDTDGIDQDLRQFIEDCTKVSQEMHEFYTSYFREYKNIERDVEAAGKLGGVIGSLDDKNPQQSAVAASLLFSMFGAAAGDAKLKELNKKYQAQYEPIYLKTKEIDQREIKLSEMLEKKYNLPFRRKQ